MGRKYKNLYEKIYEFENILNASQKARRGKKSKKEVAEFEFELEKEIFDIQEKLRENKYVFGEYRTFMITDPKEREVASAPYRDRVVHHAICNIIEPILDKAMIDDSYACRKYKGTHKAVERAEEFLTKSKWVLKFDIKKYFFTIDHEILMKKLAKKISDKKILELIKSLLETYNSSNDYYFPIEGDNLFSQTRKRGLPIGNLTSQLFANFYLNDFDRFIKEELGIKKYVRYMDDGLIFGESKEELRIIENKLKEFIKKERLKENEKKTMIFPIKNGVPFLGFSLRMNSRRILKPNLSRFAKRIRTRRYELKIGNIKFETILKSLNSWIGYAGKENIAIANKILDKIELEDNKKFKFFITGIAT